MKVTLESTDKIVTLRIHGVDVPARIWQGTTEHGIECHAYVTRVAVAKDLDASQFEAELREQAPLRADVASLPSRLIP